MYYDAQPSPVTNDICLHVNTYRQNGRSHTRVSKYCGNLLSGFHPLIITHDRILNIIWFLGRGLSAPCCQPDYRVHLEPLIRRKHSIQLWNQQMFTLIAIWFCNNIFHNPFSLHLDMRGVASVRFVLLLVTLPSIAIKIFICQRKFIAGETDTGAICDRANLMNYFRDRNIVTDQLEIETKNWFRLWDTGWYARKEWKINNWYDVDQKYKYATRTTEIKMNRR